MRPRGVPAAALDFDGEAVGRRHHRAGPEAELSDRQAGIIVHAVDFLDAEALHQPVLDHGLAAGTPLLRRLEDHDRRAGKIARLGEIARRAEQHGGMAIVAAGVHLAGHRRLIWEIVRLLDRQRIHVGAQSDDSAAIVPLAAADHPDHAGAADAGHHLVAAEALELLGHGSRGAMHVVQQLRMGVDVVPPGGDLAMQVGDAVDDRHRISSSHGGVEPEPRSSNIGRSSTAWTGQTCGGGAGLLTPHEAARTHPRTEPVAQPVEHVTFNHGVAGSSPAGLANKQQVC